MATSTPNKVDRIESADNISLTISSGATSISEETADGSDEATMMEIPISRLDTSKEIEISEVRENSLKASGYSVTSISYSGTMMFKGSKKTKTASDGSQVNLDDVLYDNNGVPQPVSISITHELASGEDGETETYQTVLVTSDSYEVRSEETTEQAYDWVAMDRTSDQE